MRTRQNYLRETDNIYFIYHKITCVSRKKRKVCCEAGQVHLFTYMHICMYINYQFKSQKYHFVPKLPFKPIKKVFYLRNFNCKICYSLFIKKIKNFQLNCAN